MSESEPRRSISAKFSLLHLLTLTALIAIGTAVAMAYRKNRAMLTYRDDLLSLSSRVHNVTENKLTLAAMPTVADDFQSWHVHVPDGDDYELRLGIGPVSETGIPPVVGTIPLKAGPHRVTLHKGDSPSEDFRYVVYVDGEPAIEKTMGREWMPNGWSSASGLNWPQGQALKDAPLQLASQSYQPTFDVGSGNYFNGQMNTSVTRSGYRLWIDQRGRAWEPTSPFIGFANSFGYQGIGLRDGLRYQLLNRSPYDWAFTRPQLQTDEPVLRIAAEFFTEDGASLTRQTQPFKVWQLQPDANADQTNSLNPTFDPTRSVYNKFLQANHNAKDAPQPIVEMKWDARRPDEVALRIADSPSNDKIQRWRLRIFDGTKHLWREMQIGERRVKADEVVKDGATKQSITLNTPDLQDSPMADIRVQWQTNEALPLQVAARQQKAYAGMGLYNGLPVAFGIQIPASLKPTLELNSVAEDPNNPGQPFPGGAVFDEIHVDLDATNHDWVWLEAKPR